MRLEDLNGVKVDLNVNEKDRPILERQFFGLTDYDKEISDLPIPRRPIWLWAIVKLIRVYQAKVARKLGNRCVFDPSCSRYSELAYREKGFFKGTVLTIKRLHRCRPENGGYDPLKKK